MFVSSAKSVQNAIKTSYSPALSAELDFVCEFYKDDLSEARPQAQLPLSQPMYESECSNEIIDHCSQCCSHSWWPLLTCEYGILTVMKLLLVMPVANASSERSFSALMRIKTYLGTTMTQKWLNNLLLLHVHKDKTETLDLLKIGREFVAGRESRLRTFVDFN